jgi:ABC-type Fe3+/spermidine/putrescine transport system ATPase subunit
MIAAEKISKRYGEVVALDDVTFGVASSEVLALVGPSGSGKTTLVRIFAGLERPDQGAISIDSEVVSTPSWMVEPHKRKLSIIFQDLALWPHMSVKGHIAFVLGGDASPAKAGESRVDRIIEDFSLGRHRDRYPHQLSGGEKQRLAIARALAPKPECLLMDEPFSNLDGILKSEMTDLIVGLQSDLGMAIIYVTHNVEEAAEIADKIAVLNHGRLIQIGAKDDVLAHPKNEFLSRLLEMRKKGS